MPLYTSLPAGAQAAYSELYDVAQHAELHRSISDLNGSIQYKSVAGRRYAYFAYRSALDGRVQQLYMGPESKTITALREAARADAPATTARQAGAALSHGCAGTITKHFRIIRQLADARFSAPAASS